MKPLLLGTMLLVTFAAPLTEDQKIEALIQTVDGIKDAAFIRNGKAHDGHAAAKHLRDKWRGKKSEVKTARDFIRLCASVSSLTGQPYLIRWKDGREQKSADFLSEKLAELEKGEKGR
ncbi:MAG TPA: DUF5329 family protein [Polyangia bacterium]|nr:DUF5329 family protein [Polyangia bacterium]